MLSLPVVEEMARQFRLWRSIPSNEKLTDDEFIAQLAKDFLGREINEKEIKQIAEAVKK